MLIRTLPAFLLLLVSFSSFSQTDSVKVRKKFSSDLLISFNSTLIYPGIRLGIEFPLYKVNLSKNIKNGKTVSVIKDRLISVKSGWYHHPGFHDNLYLTAEWTMRRTNKKGFLSEFNAGPGYSRTFLGGTTYQVDNYGNVKILKSAGYNYVLITAGGGVGYDFSKKKGVPLSIFYKLDILTMFPYNSTIYFRPAMELGIIYTPEDFLQVMTKIRNVKR
jgi:hypothetical protein